MGWGFDNLPDDGFKQLAAQRTDIGDPLGEAYYLDVEPHRTAVQCTTTGMLIAIKTDSNDDGSWKSAYLPFG